MCVQHSGAVRSQTNGDAVLDAHWPQRPLRSPDSCSEDDGAQLVCLLIPTTHLWLCVLGGGGKGGGEAGMWILLISTPTVTYQWVNEIVEKPISITFCWRAYQFGEMWLKSWLGVPCQQINKTVKYQKPYILCMSMLEPYITLCCHLIVRGINLPLGKRKLHPYSDLPPHIYKWTHMRGSSAHTLTYLQQT